MIGSTGVAGVSAGAGVPPMMQEGPMVQMTIVQIAPAMIMSENEFSWSLADWLITVSATHTTMITKIRQILGNMFIMESIVSRFALR